MSNLHRSNFQGHPFHLVSPSPWPLFTCISLLTLTTSGVLTMHGFSNSEYWLPCALICLVSSMAFWFRDIISERTYLGNHTLAVQRGLNMGVALFIVSEALFFLAIFWAYFHSALSPTVELGAQWPPLGIEAINAFELPLLNTVLLLASGVTITYSHHSLIQGNRNGALLGAIFTVFLAMIFTAFQGVEYAVSSFSFTDYNFTTAYAEQVEYNTEVRELGCYLLEAKYNALQQRNWMGAPSSKVSLTDIGWRLNNPHLSDKTFFFERFIDKNPHLNAFNQYYRWRNNFSVHRDLASVNITEELTDALCRRRDLSI